MHSQSGVTDFVVEDEVAALRKVREILNYIPDNTELARYQPSSDPIDRKTWDIDILLKRRLADQLQHAVRRQHHHPADLRSRRFPRGPGRPRAQHDHGIRPHGRARGGFVANNSAVASGQIDIDAAYKNARFIRF